MLRALHVELDVCRRAVAEDLVQRGRLDRVGSGSNARSNGPRCFEAHRATLRGRGERFDADRADPCLSPVVNAVLQNTTADWVRLDRDDLLELSPACGHEGLDCVAVKRPAVYIHLAGQGLDQIIGEVGLSRRSRRRERRVIEQEAPTDLGLILGLGLGIGPDRGRGLDLSRGLGETLRNPEVQAVRVGFRQYPGQLSAGDRRHAQRSTLLDHAAVCIDGDQPHGALPKACRCFVGTEDFQTLELSSPTRLVVVDEGLRLERQADQIAAYLPPQVSGSEQHHVRAPGNAPRDLRPPSVNLVPPATTQDGIQIDRRPRQLDFAFSVSADETAPNSCSSTMPAITWQTNAWHS